MECHLYYLKYMFHSVISLGYFKTTMNYANNAFENAGLIKMCLFGCEEKLFS